MSVHGCDMTEVRTIRSFLSLAVSFGFPFFFGAGFGGADLADVADVDVMAVVKVVSHSAVSL